MWFYFEDIMDTIDKIQYRTRTQWRFNDVLVLLHEPNAKDIEIMVTRLLLLYFSKLSELMGAHFLLSEIGWIAPRAAIVAYFLFHLVLVILLDNACYRLYNELSMLQGRRWISKNKVRSYLMDGQTRGITRRVPLMVNGNDLFKPCMQLHSHWKFRTASILYSRVSRSPIWSIE